MSNGPPDTGFVCNGCKRRWYYARACCPDCGSRDYTTCSLGAGRLIATTVTHVTPNDIREPNALGLAKFDSGVHVIAQLAETYDDPRTNDPVRLRGEHTLRGLSEDLVTGPQLTRVTADEER